MSSTRHAVPGTGFHQERYASSEEYERGLMANLVAKKCSLIADRSERELIWFLQFLSHQEGGLDKVATDVLERYTDRIGTPSMHRFGMREGQLYTAAQTRAIGKEIPAIVAAERMDDMLDREHEVRPNRTSAAEYLKLCREESDGLANILRLLCLDPETRFGSEAHWYFPTLRAALAEYMETYAAAKHSGRVETEIGRLVKDSLEFSWREKAATVIEGMARMGKSFSAEVWCSARPGCARIVQVPSTTDDKSFFRAIAESLGVSRSYGMKACDLSSRIEDALKGGDIMLVFDEAHHLWGAQGRIRDLWPRRVNWLMLALINRNIPVALITTKQFTTILELIEKKSHWASEQWRGRVSHHELLPDGLSGKDVEAVARNVLPRASDKTIEELVCHAMASAQYLGAISSVAKRARYLAFKEGRSDVSAADVKAAVQTCRVSDRASLKVSRKAMERPPAPRIGPAQVRGRQVAGTALSEGLQSVCQAPEIAAGVLVGVDR